MITYGNVYVQRNGHQSASGHLLRQCRITNYSKLFINVNRANLYFPQGYPSMTWNFTLTFGQKQKLIFSEVVPGPLLQKGTWAPPTGICDVLKFHLESPEYKMILPVEPRFNIPLSQAVTVSILVGRKDSNQVACVINKSVFDYIDRSAYRALAFDYLEFSPAHPFVSGIRAWISLLFMHHSNEGLLDVFGIELDFCDAANSKDQVLWLLDMLDWK